MGAMEAYISAALVCKKSPRVRSPRRGVFIYIKGMVHPGRLSTLKEYMYMFFGVNLGPGEGLLLILLILFTGIIIIIITVLTSSSYA